MGGGVEGGACIQAGLLLATNDGDEPTALDPFTLAPLVQSPASASLQLSVIIPARDEEATLPAALDALARQVDITGQPLPTASYEVIVLANNCRDATVAAALACGMRHPALRLHVVECTLPPDEAHVGRARRLLMDEACRRFWLLGRPRGVIASTDADSRVAPNWVAATLAAVARGADAVGGRILVDPAELATLDPAARALHLRDVGYRSLVAEYESRLDPDPTDPWPRHFQHFGPSIAVTAERYRQIGGLPVRPWLEDVAFASALYRADARLRHDPRVRVSTSARPDGRTAFGFAGQLGAWGVMGRSRQPFLVESAAAIAERACLRAALRHCWQDARSAYSPALRALFDLASRLGIDAGTLLTYLAEAETFGALYERVLREQVERGEWEQRWPLVPIETAIPELRARVIPLRAMPLLVRQSLEQVEPVAGCAAAD